MKAMIFAAGLGTRLKPLTDSKPKALVEINGKPLLYYAITKLKEAGISSIIINTHHFSNQIIQYVHDNNFDIEITISDETEKLLNTGGGLINAKHFLDGNESFIVYNVDIISNIDLNKMLQYHLNTKALVTLAVMDRQTSRYFLFDNENTLCGWINKKENSQRISRHSDSYSELAFSGIQIINPQIFSFISQTGSFPIVDTYLELAKIHLIKGYNHSNTLWCDLGKLEELEKAGEMITKIYY
jgi:NDP-sugar pyrophosphorylase family protein